MAAAQLNWAAARVNHLAFTMDAVSTSCVGMFEEMFSIHYGSWLSLGVLWVFDVEMDQDIGIHGE